MTLEQTLSNGVKIWKAPRIIEDGGKFVKFTSFTYIAPFRINELRFEEVCQFRYMGTTGMKTTKVTETTDPVDVISVVSGVCWLYMRNKDNDSITKIRVLALNPKIIEVPVNRCDYGILSNSSECTVVIKKNYRRFVTEITKLLE